MRALKAAPEASVGLVYDTEARGMIAAGCRYKLLALSQLSTSDYFFAVRKSSAAASALEAVCATSLIWTLYGAEERRAFSSLSGDDCSETTGSQRAAVAIPLSQYGFVARAALSAFGISGALLLAEMLLGWVLADAARLRMEAILLSDSISCASSTLPFHSQLWY